MFWSPTILPEFPDQARESLGPDPHRERVLMHIDPLDEQLDDARLFDWEQLVPDRGEVREQDRDVAFGDLVFTRPLRGRPCPDDQLRRGQQLLDLVEDCALSAT